MLSSKRGFADFSAGYSNLQATGAGWYHTWQPGVGNPGNFDAQHIPMFRNWTPIGSTINDIKNRPNVEWVMGFNEPERTDQDNMTVSQAISAWTQISNGFAGTGKKLVTPAVSDTSDGRAWMTDFKNQTVANGLQVDAVAFHWYGWSTPDNISQAASNFMGSVNWYHNLWNKPVFISEFAIHDWGGNYTDEQISEANRQFLDIVVPQLESLSWVEGYAWYHWFGDAHLYDDNPPKPTRMAYEYTGVIQSGETYDVSGVDHGEHVAYLAGGQLTYGGGSPGTLRYVDALEGSSTITGAADWQLTAGGRLRVRPGATLRKVGSNQVSLNGGSVDNQGVIRVAEGVLKLTNGATASGNGTIAVAQGAILDLDAPFSTFYLGAGQTIHTNSNATVTGGLVATSGSVVSGAGVFTDTITMQSGSILRVGRAGLPVLGLIDDFDAYDNAANQNIGSHSSGDVTGGVWDGVFDGTSNGRVVDNANPADNALQAFGLPSQGGNGWRGGVTDLASNFSNDFSLANGDTATYFFQVMNEGNASADTMIGLTESAGSLDIVEAWRDFAVMPYVAGSAGNASLRVYGDNIGDRVIAPLTDGQWQNVWLVVNNAEKSFDIYTSTGVDAGELALANIEFGRITDPINLEAFGIAGGGDGRVRIDNLYRLDGVDTSNPLVTQGAFGETLTVEGSLVLSGATIEVDVAAGAHDLLNVTGSANLTGVLAVTLHPGYTPALNDAFTVITADAITNNLALGGPHGDMFSLAASTPTEIVLTVASGLAGDYNNDGVVDAADYTVWRDNMNAPAGSLFNDFEGVAVGQAQYLAWRANYGMTLPSATDKSSATAAVPEPAAVLLLVGAAAVVPGRRRPREL